MLLSSARATLDAPSASAVAITNCLFSECGLRDMAYSFKTAAIKRNGPGANNNVRLLQAALAWPRKFCQRTIAQSRYRHRLCTGVLGTQRHRFRSFECR